MVKDLDRLKKAIAEQGFEIVALKTAGHTAVFTAHGAWITNLPGTPSDHRGFDNALADLRRAGFIWPPLNKKEMRARRRKQNRNGE